MKKLLIVAIVLLIAVLMAMTVPDKQEHKEAMMKAVTEFVEEEAAEKYGDNVLTNIGKGVVLKTVEVALNSKLREGRHVLWNTTARKAGRGYEGQGRSPDGEGSCQDECPRAEETGTRTEETREGTEERAEEAREGTEERTEAP